MNKYNTKQCSKCSEILPASPNYFYKDKNKKDGLKYACIECKGGKYRDIENAKIPKLGFKICSHCKRELPRSAEYFYKNKRKKDGLTYGCIECQGGKFRKIAKPGHKICNVCLEEKEANSENFHKYIEGALGLRAVCRCCIKSQTNKRYKRNIEENRKKRREYSRKNKQQRNAYYKKYYRENIDKVRENHKEYRLKNPHIQKGATIRRRTRLMNLPYNFSEEEWVECKQNFNNECAYCGEKNFLERDHFIPLTKGGEFTKNNVIPSCRSCNSSKGNKNFFEWYREREDYSPCREKKILNYLNYNETKNQQLALF